MELILTMITLSGLVVFFIAWLLVIISAFRHHLITGIIALVPILSFSILPSIWNKTAKSIVVSIVTAFIVLSAWLIGSKNNINTLTFNHITQNNSRQVDHNAPPSIRSLTNNSLNSTLLSPYKTPLPKKALYYLMFKEVDRQYWDHLKDSLIRITFEDKSILEGRVANILPDRLVIKYHNNKESKLFETSTQHIIQLEKLIKQPSI